MVDRRPSRASPSRLAALPFDPARLPFFYGWAVLGCGALGVLMSAPGQTVGVSVFTDFLIEELGLSRSMLSLAYLFGTLGSALLLSRAGRIYDHLGGRWVAAIAAATLSAVLLVLSLSPAIVDALSAPLPRGLHGAVAFAVMMVSFFLLRFSGQGILSLASRNMVMEWFEARRGLANALLGVTIAFGFSLAPRAFESLVQSGGWQWAWQKLSQVAAGFACFALLFYRARPEDHGLKPDGGSRAPRRGQHAEAAPGRPFTLEEARRTRSFWIFSGSAVLAGLLLTAFTFHVVSFFADAGMSREQAVSVFIPAAFVAVFFEFAGSWLSDYIKLKVLVMVQLCASVLLSLSLTFLGDGLPVILVIAGMGTMQGLFGATITLAWPRFFGRLHLGAISGFATSLVVAGTALGPYLFSFARDLSGSYAPATLGCAIAGLVLLIVAPSAERPE